MFDWFKIKPGTSFDGVPRTSFRALSWLLDDDPKFFNSVILIVPAHKAVEKLWAMVSFRGIKWNYLQIYTYIYRTAYGCSLTAAPGSHNNFRVKYHPELRWKDTRPVVRGSQGLAARLGTIYTGPWSGIAEIGRGSVVPTKLTWVYILYISYVLARY